MTPGTNTHPILWSEEHLDGAAELLRISDELSVDTGLLLAERLDTLAADGRRGFVLDLSRVSKLDPIAVVPLVGVSRRLRLRGVRVSLVLDPLLVLFEIPGIEEFDDVTMTLDGALERLHEPVAPARQPSPLPAGTVHDVSTRPAS